MIIYKLGQELTLTAQGTTDSEGVVGNAEGTVYVWRWWDGTSTTTTTATTTKVLNRLGTVVGGVSVVNYSVTVVAPNGKSTTVTPSISVYAPPVFASPGGGAPSVALSVNNKIAGDGMTYATNLVFGILSYTTREVDYTIERVSGDPFAATITGSVSAIADTVYPVTQAITVTGAGLAKLTITDTITGASSYVQFSIFAREPGTIQVTELLAREFVVCDASTTSTNGTVTAFASESAGDDLDFVWSLDNSGGGPFSALSASLGTNPNKQKVGNGYSSMVTVPMANVIAGVGAGAIYVTVSSSYTVAPVKTVLVTPTAIVNPVLEEVLITNGVTVVKLTVGTSEFSYTPTAPNPLAPTATWVGNVLAITGGTFKPYECVYVRIRASSADLLSYALTGLVGPSPATVDATFAVFRLAATPGLNTIQFGVQGQHTKTTGAGKVLGSITLTTS